MKLQELTEMTRDEAISKLTAILRAKQKVESDLIDRGLGCSDLQYHPKVIKLQTDLNFLEQIIRG